MILLAFFLLLGGAGVVRDMAKDKKTMTTAIFWTENDTNTSQKEEFKNISTEVSFHFFQSF